MSRSVVLPAQDSLPARLVIASRESRLAMWQAEHVQARLRALHPAMDVRILGMTTVGDQVLDRALSEIGGKGLFTKELEQALLDGRADLAVHSLKDVPMVLPDGFTLAAIMEREDPRDAFVSNTYPSLGALPPGARVGTSSLRRAAQLRARHPHLEVLSLRGNVNTRLAKLDAGHYDAIILAAAGLKRLGMFTRIRAVLPPTTSLPAVGQGALAIEVLAGRPAVQAAVAPLVDVATTLQVNAERALARRLGGNCRMPLAAFCETDPDGALVLAGLVAMPDGSRLVHAQASGTASIAGAEALGLEVAASLLAQGADEILKQFA